MGDYRSILHRGGTLTVQLEAPIDPHVGLVERFIDFSSLEFRSDHYIVAPLIMNERSAIEHRFLGVQHRRQWLVANFDQFGRIFGNVAVSRYYCRDDVTDEVYLSDRNSIEVASLIFRRKFFGINLHSQGFAKFLRLFAGHYAMHTGMG